MIRNLFLLIAGIILTGCSNTNQLNQNVITSDIDNFWEAFDKITATQDSVLQYKYLDSLYLQKGTLGLQGIMQARNYTAQEYIHVINDYPKFWNSVRDNTLKANSYREEIQQGIEKVKQLYPVLKPNKIYFTIGALRTGGTYIDSLALIGTEMAMADENTDASEFPESIRQGRQTYFNQNPIDDLVFLAVQEFVHTQQKPFVHNLLSYCLHEGVGDFVSYKALDIEPNLPAIIYGKQNEEVREKFEEEMFKGNNISDWLWSDSSNEFGVRDLGYYIGYQVCENYYNQAQDKREAIKTMIELDYENNIQIEDFIQKSNFFSASLDKLEQDFEKKRPTIIDIKPFENKSIDVNPKTNEIVLTFSHPMNQQFRRFEYGPLGEEAALRIKTVVGWSADGKSLTLQIDDLIPNKQYQLVIDSGFRNLDNVPLKPYLLEFKTSK